MAKPIVDEIIVPDPSSINPEIPADYARRGWLYLSKKQFDLATQDFKQLLAAEPDNIDGWYALGLALKSSGVKKEAVDAFEKVLQLMGGIEDKRRISMLTRLTHGQVNQLTTGEWNLEKEVWKRVA
jgi:tetratricopeptide (TPR) repeat protein